MHGQQDDEPWQEKSNFSSVGSNFSSLGKPERDTLNQSQLIVPHAQGQHLPLLLLLLLLDLFSYLSSLDVTLLAEDDRDCHVSSFSPYVITAILEQLRKSERGEREREPEREIELERLGDTFFSNFHVFTGDA
jgi:hypothetical protein